MAQKKRDVLQDFDGFVRDVKMQYGEQQRLIEQQIEQQNVLLLEMTDFCKKRGEIEMQYVSALDKLVRRQHPHYPQSALGRTWQSMLESTRKMRDGHAVFANNYTNKVCEHLTSITSHFPVLLKRYRDLHNSLQQDEVGRLKKFRERIDLYRQSCVRLAEDRSKANKCTSKFGGAKPGAPADVQATPGGGTRKERELAKALSAVDASAQKTEQMRNEYILAVQVENVALDRLLNSDFTYATSFLDWFFRKAMARTFRLALIGDNYSTTTQRCEDALRAAVEELDTSCLPFPRAAPPLPEPPIGNGASQPEMIDWNIRALVDQLWAQRGDYRHTFEQSQAAFVPRSLSFEPGREDTERELHISAEGSGNALMKTSASCKESMREVRERIARLIPELERIKRDLTTKFVEPLDVVFSSPSNLSPLPESNVGSLDSLALLTPNAQQVHAIAKNTQEMFMLADLLFSRKCDYMGCERQFEILRCKFEAIRPVLYKYCVPTPSTVRAAPSAPITVSTDRSRPRREVFGVRLVNYVEMTHEPIPNVVRSCVHFLTENALQHAGIFRVSGSQPEILDLRARFNAGEDPLEAAPSVLDVNNVTSLLKLYFRELPDPLIPPPVAQTLIDLRGTLQSDEARLRAELRTILRRDIPAAHYAVLRFLLEFLSNVTSYDENMMDAHNLAVCFGPTITQPLCDEPVPPHMDDSAELVSKQRSINDLIADLIINFREVFESDTDTVDSKTRNELRADPNLARARAGNEFELDENEAARQRHNSMHSAGSASLNDLNDALQSSVNIPALTRPVRSHADSVSESQSADEATSLSDKNVAVELDVVFKPSTDTPTRKLPVEPNNATKPLESLVVSANTREPQDGLVNASPKRTDAATHNWESTRNDLIGPRAAPDGRESPRLSADSRPGQKPVDEQEVRRPPPVARKPVVIIKK